jgi:hypothetical protein
MESNTSLLFEMRMLNELRKLKPDQRKELIDTLEREEKLEEDALKKNPNLHVETKLSHVLGELKNLRAEVQVIKNTCNNCPVMNSNSNHMSNRIGEIKLYTPQEDDSSSECLDCCSLFSSSIDWWPIIIFIFIFLTIFSLPSSKTRQCPIIL